MLKNSRYPNQQVLVISLLLLSFSIGTLVLQADAPDNNLQVTAATFLGGDGDDVATAVAIAPDGTIVIAGQMVGQNFALTPTDIDGGGDGVLLRLDETGQTLLSITRFSGLVTDMDLDRSSGHISVIGDFGLYTLSSDGETVLWQADPGSSNTMRVAVAANGNVAALVASSSSTNTTRQLSVYAAANGTPLADFPVTITESLGGQLTDVAVSDTAVFVTGFRQVSNNLKLPLLRSYDYEGTIQWQGYAFSSSEANNQGDNADSEGKRLAIGQDGQLYLAGRTDGGNNVFRRNPQDSNQNANNPNFDLYTSTSNIGGGSFGYFTRLDPATGVQDAGQYVVMRRTSDGFRGNSFGINAITADENGRVYLGGGAFFALPCRPTSDNAIVDSNTLCPSHNPLRINDTIIGNYTSNEGAVLALSPDLSSRPLVAAWTGSDPVASSPVQAVAAVDGVRVMVATVNEGGNLITANPIQPVRGSGLDMFVSVWSDPTAAIAPVALNDTANTIVNGLVRIRVLDNDTDANGDELEIVDVGQPNHGSAVALNSGRIRYIPNEDFVGTDSFVYLISDSELTDTALVTVRVWETAVYLPMIRK